MFKRFFGIRKLGEIQMDMKLLRILDQGTNEERLVLKAIRSCNLNEYIVFDTTYDENGVASNKHRHLYVFPYIDVEADDTVVLYSKKGKYSTIKNENGTTSHFFYWNLDIHVWNNEGDTAYLLHYDAVDMKKMRYTK